MFARSTASLLFAALLTGAAFAQYGGGPPPPPPNRPATQPGTGSKDQINSGSGNQLGGGSRRSNGTGSRFSPGDLVPKGGDAAPAPAPVRGGAAPAGPSTPTGPSGPSGLPAGASSSRGAGLDLSPPIDAWDLWWSANRERYLDVRARIDSQSTSPETPEGDGTPAGRGFAAELRTRVAEHLFAVLEGRRAAGSTEIDAALIAAGKLSHDRARASAAIQRHLGAGSQTTRELAALSLGLLGDGAALPLLLALASDLPLAHAVAERSAIDVRTRAFAIYGLGLLARQPELAETAPRLVREALLELLSTYPQQLDHEIATAALCALGVLPLGEHERWTHVFPALEGALSKSGSWDFVRAHVPTSAARLQGAPWGERFATLAESDEEHPVVRASALLALGHCAEDLSPAHRARALRALAIARERQAGFSERAFATLALGQLGDEAKLAELEASLERGAHLDQPWIALALGLAARRDGERGVDIAPRVSALRSALRAARAPETRGALAIALGLARSMDAAEDLRAAFLAERIGRTKGYLGLALGMLGDTAAIPSIRAALSRGSLEPDEVDALATSLGLLGDVGGVPLLVERMKGARDVSELGGLAAGLGRIGNAATAEALLALAGDAATSSLSRTYAISALGMLFETGPLPWNALYAEDVNYFATTPTLGGGNGVLDLL